MKQKLFIIALCLSFIFPTAGPNSGGTFATDCGVDEGVRLWDNASNAASSNNVYATISAVQTDDVSCFIVATNFGFAVPGGSTINGIVVEWERRSDHEDFVEDAPITLHERIVKGDVIGTADKSDATEWESTDTYHSFGGASDLWGETWTTTDINASDFGAAGCGFIAANNALTTAYVDHCRITVYYTEAGGTKKRIIGYAGEMQPVITAIQ